MKSMKMKKSLIRLALLSFLLVLPVGSAMTAHAKFHKIFKPVIVEEQERQDELEKEYQQEKKSKKKTKKKNKSKSKKDEKKNVKKKH